MKVIEHENNLLAATTYIVVAQVGKTGTDAGEIPGLIAKVYGALSALGAPAVPEVPPQEPAVPIRASIKPDHVVCLECGGMVCGPWPSKGGRPIDTDWRISKQPRAFEIEEWELI